MITKSAIIASIAIGASVGGFTCPAAIIDSLEASYAVVDAGTGGNFQTSSDDLITGNVGLGSGVGNSASPGTITGTVTTGLSQSAPTGVIQDLLSLSTGLGALTGTSISIGGTTSISATGGTLDSSGTYAGDYVYNVTSLNTSSGQTITINGSASDNVVFNVDLNGANFKAGVVLTGGITANDVVFNFDQPQSENGPSISDNGATVSATILDMNGKVNFDNTTIDGHIYGGYGNNDFQVVSGAYVDDAGLSTVPEAPTYFAGLFVLIPVAGRVWCQVRARTLKPGRVDSKSNAL